MVFKKGFPKCTLSTPIGLNDVPATNCKVYDMCDIIAESQQD